MIQAKYHLEWGIAAFLVFEREKNYIACFLWPIMKNKQSCLETLSDKTCECNIITVPDDSLSDIC